MVGLDCHGLALRITVPVQRACVVRTRASGVASGRAGLDQAAPTACVSQLGSPAHHRRPLSQAFSTVNVYIIEGLLPFLFFAPSPLLRKMAALAQVALMVRHTASGAHPDFDLIVSDSSVLLCLCFYPALALDHADGQLQLLQLSDRALCAVRLLGSRSALSCAELRCTRCRVPRAPPPYSPLVFAADLGAAFAALKRRFSDQRDKALPDLPRTIDPTLATAVVIGVGAILARFFGASFTDDWTPSFEVTFSRRDFDQFVTVSMIAGMVLGALGLVHAIFTDMYNSK